MLNVSSCEDERRMQAFITPVSCIMFAVLKAITKIKIKLLYSKKLQANNQSFNHFNFNSIFLSISEWNFLNNIIQFTLMIKCQKIKRIRSWRFSFQAFLNKFLFHLNWVCFLWSPNCWSQSPLLLLQLIYVPIIETNLISLGNPISFMLRFNEFRFSCKWLVWDWITLLTWLSVFSCFVLRRSQYRREIHCQHDSGTRNINYQ